LTTRYTETHEWVRGVKAESQTFRLGISPYAQGKLGDVAYVDLPEVSDEVIEQGSDICAIESTKACGEILMPVDGTITQVNELLADQPELVNTDPENQGWLFQFQTNHAEDLDQLMDSHKYQQFIEELDD